MARAVQWVGLLALVASAAAAPLNLNPWFLMVDNPATQYLQQWLPAPHQEEAAPKVKVDFYEESLCPYCSAFVRNDLSALVNSELLDIVELRLIPYGNAKMSASGKIVCQHGPLECTGNLIEACAITLYPNVTEWFPFIKCLAGKGTQLVAGTATCAKETGLDRKKLRACYKGPQGAKLIKEYAEETNALQPAHEYVPWLVVDEEPAYDHYDEVAALVCQAYKGSKPKPCSTVAATSHKGSASASPMWTAR